MALLPETSRFLQTLHIVPYSYCMKINFAGDGSLLWLVDVIGGLCHGRTSTTPRGSLGLFRLYFRFFFGPSWQSLAVSLAVIRRLCDDFEVSGDYFWMSCSDLSHLFLGVFVFFFFFVFFSSTRASVATLGLTLPK